MKKMKLLLLSNSANKGEDYLVYPREQIISFLGTNIKNILFIPFAAVTFGFNEYELLVADRLDDMGDYKTTSIHRSKNFAKAIEEAEAIAVGGGNTYMLLDILQKYNLIESLRKKILNGTPYIGWSAGANITCPTIATTNDMPIVWPKTLHALNLVPFQINPHYTNRTPEDFAGESREMRLREYVEVNRGMNVVALPEGSLLKVENDTIGYIGRKKGKVFNSDKSIMDIIEDENLSFLLNE